MLTAGRDGTMLGFGLGSACLKLDNKTAAQQLFTKGFPSPKRRRTSRRKMICETFLTNRFDVAALMQPP
jgi:hypothetical protein